MPIRSVKRQFYFMGEAYTSLPELVSTFCNTGAEPINSDHSIYDFDSESAEMTKYVCTCTFEGDQGTEEISATAGDILTGVEDFDSHWVLARNERTGAHGYIPSYVLVPLVCQVEDPVDLPYFHNPVSKDALQRLVHMGPGSFFLRYSSRGEGSFALAVNTRAGHVEKFLIRAAEDAGGGFVLAGRRFSSVQHILERYCRFPITSGLCLTHAVFASSISSSTSSSTPWSTETTPDDEQKPIVSASVASTSRAVASVQALRKSKEEKPWKPCWLTLRDDPQSSCQLIVSDDDTALRVRVTLDLPFSTLYVLDESVFSREGCLFISQNDIDVPGIFISLQPFPVFAEWIGLLRPRSLGLQPGSLPLLNGFQFNIPKTPNIGILRVFIDKYSSDALKADGKYSAYGSVNGIKLCTTQALSPSGKVPPTLVFDSSFLIPFTPVGAGSFQVFLMSHNSGKKIRPFGMSPLLALSDAEMTKYNFEQSFTLRMARNSVAVSSDHDYQLIREWLENPSVGFLEFVSDALSTQDRALLSLSLVSSLISQPNLLLGLIESLLTDILATATPDSVLRQDSLATSLLTHTLRVSARFLFENSLEKTGTVSSRLPDLHDLEFAVNCVMNLTEDPIVAHVLALVKRLAEQRFGDQVHVVRRVLSVVMILRFANPLILSYYQGLPFGQYLAKGVQGAANAATSRTSQPVEDGSHTVALRNLFDTIGSSLPKLPSTASPLGRDWLAVACYLMNSVVSSKTGVPNVPEAVLRVILAHKPC